MKPKISSKRFKHEILKMHQYFWSPTKLTYTNVRRNGQQKNREFMHSTIDFILLLFLLLISLKWQLLTFIFNSAQYGYKRWYRQNLKVLLAIAASFTMQIVFHYIWWIVFLKFSSFILKRQIKWNDYSITGNWDFSVCTKWNWEFSSGKNEKASSIDANHSRKWLQWYRT